MARTRWRSRPFDAVLAGCMAAFILGWATYDLPRIIGLDVPALEIYAETIDPFVRAAPLHIELVLGAAGLLFGPAYIVILYGLWRQAPWTGRVALPLGGLLTGTNAIYMAAALTSAHPPLNLPAFLALNGPYSVVALLLVLRFACAPLGDRSASQPVNCG